jgi:cobalamin biosynthesis Mg chelatase CobN
MKTGTEAATTDRNVQKSTILAIVTPEISKPTETENSEKPQTTSTDKVHTAAAAESKNKKSQVLTTSIVVPVVVILLLAVFVIVWIVRSQRKR